MKTLFHKFLVVICFGILVPNVFSQWYQGPTGGRDGSKFDFWKDSGGNPDLGGIRILHDQDNSILCLSLSYRNGFTSKYGGHCNETGPRAGLIGQGFYGDWSGFAMDNGEYLVGITGQFDDEIHTIDFYTSKGRRYQFGKSGGSDTFGYTAPTGQRIVALFGRSGSRINSLGVMYAPIPGNPRVQRPGSTQ